MTYKTHLIGGAQAGIIAASALCNTRAESALVIGTALVGSVLPDIDYKKSKLCESDWLIGAMAYWLSGVTRHRGFTHTIPGIFTFALILMGGTVYKNTDENLFAVYAAIAVFCIMHIIGGAAGKMGALAAILTYLAGPEIMNILRGHAVELAVDPGAARLCALGLIAGCLIHLVYDTFNPKGVMWLYPLSRKSISVAGIRLRSHGELVFAAVQIVILAVIIAFFCF